MSPFFEDPVLYRSVLENLPIGIYVLDREQRVRFWNRGAEQITGYLAHEVIGHVCHESLPHCDPQGLVLAGDHCAITTTFRDGRAVQNHVFTLHKQGHRLGVRFVPCRSSTTGTRSLALRSLSKKPRRIRRRISPVR